MGRLYLPVGHALIAAPGRKAGWAGTTAHLAGGCCNTSMSDAIEQRLAAAAESAQEHALCGRQLVHLCARERAAAVDLDTAQEQYAGEERRCVRMPADSSS